MKKERKYKLLTIFVLFLISLTPIFWYRPDSIIAGGDMGLPLDIDVYLKKGISTWDSSINAGKNSVFGLSRLPEYLFFKLISFSGLPINKIGIVYFCLVCLGILLSFNFFISQFLSEDKSEEKILIPFFGAIFYLFNFFSITRFEGFDRPILYVMIGTPLLLGLITRNIKKEKISNYFFIGLSSLVFSYSVVNVPSFLAGILVILLFYVFLIASSLWRKNYARLGRIVTLGVKNLVVILGCNLFWIIPTLNLGSPKAVFAGVAPIDWLGSISQSCTPINVIRLMGAWHWYQSGSAPYAQVYLQNKYFIFLTYLVPLFCFLGLLLSLLKRKKSTLFLIPILLLGLIFSMGDNGPFGKVYKFLYDNLIFFRVFRSPWFKFSLLTILAYSFYYGLFATVVCRLVKKYLPKIFFYFSIVLFFLFPIVLSHPLITASIYKDWRVKVPSYVENAIDFIDEKLKEGERVYVYTFDQNSNYSWGYLSVTPALFRLSLWPTIGPWYSVLPNDLINHLLRVVDLRLRNGSNQKISNFLSYLGVKYLLFRRDILFLEEQQFKFIGEQFKKRKNIKFVSTFSEWDVYENPNPLPLFIWKDRLVGVSDMDTFLTTVDQGETKDIYCIDCEYPQGVINKYHLNPGDFSLRENKVRSFGFETKEELNYIFSVKTANPSRDVPVVYLNNEKMVLRKDSTGYLFTGNKLLMPGKHKVGLEESVFLGENFVKNGDFSEGLSFWDYFEEGVYYDLPIKSSLEKFGTGRVKLAAINKPVVMSQKVSGLEKNKKYRLRFNFKSLEKLPLQVGISTQQIEATKFIVDPGYQKFYSKKETAREIIFESDFPTVFINFYTKVNSIEPNPQVIGNVSLKEAGLIESLEVVPSVGQSYQDFSYLKQSATEYQLQFTSGNSGWLTFNVTCDKGWRAFEDGKELDSLCVNSFANGYYVSHGGEHKIELYYFPERIYKKMLRISLAFIILFMFPSTLDLLTVRKKNSDI